jgi:uncharacterized protein (DUF433 family)
MFPIIPFSRELAARATGLSESRIQRWVREGVYTTFYADAGIGDPKHPSRGFSYGDVVVLRALAALRREGVGLDELGQVATRIKSLPDDEWANSRLVVRPDGVQLERVPDVDRRTADNGAHPTVTIPLSRIVQEVNDKVRELGTRTEDEVGHISRNRRIMHGLPVLAGTRIPTATIYSLRQSGYDDDWILENYPRLRPPDIAAAIAFEEARRRERVAR